jgi:sRNA-binding protein
MLMREITNDPLAYLKALVEPGAMRYDLDGQPIEPVKDAHKKWAEEMLLKKLSE